MKKIAIALFALILAAAVSASAQNLGKYEKTAGKVYYDGLEMRYADPGTFKDLGYGYAKDSGHVYYMGQVLPYVAPSDFKTDERYGLDRNDRPNSEKPEAGKPGNGKPEVHKVDRHSSPYAPAVMQTRTFGLAKSIARKFFALSKHIVAPAERRSNSKITDSIYYYAKVDGFVIVFAVRNKRKVEITFIVINRSASRKATSEISSV